MGAYSLEVETGKPRDDQSTGADCCERALSREPQVGVQRLITSPDPWREHRGVRNRFSEGVGILVDS